MRFILLIGLSLLITSELRAQTSGDTKIPINSPAFVFSPGNWTGDQGRGGSVFRQTWYPGAYFRVNWNTSTDTPTAVVLLDTSTLSPIKSKPQMTYCIDGVWVPDVSCNSDKIPIINLKGSGEHSLTVYFSNSYQTARWGKGDTSGNNIIRVTGLQVDSGSTAVPTRISRKWALIVGDSITEGSAANFGRSDNLADWSYFVGQALQEKGYEYGISACGWSGWLNRGDVPPGDVPAYFFVSAGTYDDQLSRWNKIDAAHSILDSMDHISAYGETNQEPALILINYGTNDSLYHMKSEDLRASITQSITALRKSAPDSVIYLIVPFGQYINQDIKAGLADYKTAAPFDQHVGMIDLGQPVANALSAGGYWGNLHPNMRAHAVFAARILSKLVIP